MLITADTTPDLIISPARGLTVRDLGSDTRYTLPNISGVTRWRLNVDGSKTVVGYFDGAWHRYQPGGHAALVGDGQFHAAVPLTLWTSAGSRTYRGWLRGASPSPGSATRDTVNVVSLDSYVQGVIPAEMPASWSAEALKAQAVAARTYATWSRDDNADRSYQICDTSSCQVYRGVSGEDPRANAAVDATRGHDPEVRRRRSVHAVRLQQRRLDLGRQPPYLVAKADPYDDFSGNPVHSWTSS